MSEFPPVERLPCGTELASLVDQVAERTPPLVDAHQAVCPHCRAALAELEELWGYVRALAREPVIAPARLVERVIRRVREELAALARLPLELVVPRLVRHALLSGPRGTTRVASSVVAMISALAAQEVAGLSALGP